MPALVPYLDYQQKGRPLRRISLQKFPFRIGRSARADHTIPSVEVSGLHAEIVKDGDAVVLRDLGSTNGTFVNAERIETRALAIGDVVHFATEEHRFGFAERVDEDEAQATVWSRADTERLMRETHDLGRVLGLKAVTAVFQPIVQLSDSARIAYEQLGRVTIEDGRYSISDTLRIADGHGQAATLSRLIRAFAIAAFPLVPETPIDIFFNLHPAEMSDLDETFREFERVVAGLGKHQRAVLEIHEGAVTDPKTMRVIRERLRALNMLMAYDDFGAGQSRLMELVEVPPDYLKLDISLVRDIDRSARRQDLVRALVSVMRDLGSVVIAEGIERAEEGDVCRELGCALGQGYFYGRPARLPQSPATIEELQEP